MTQRPLTTHPDPHEIAAYVDATLADDRRDAVTAHLAACASCRAEVAEVGGIVRTAPRSARAARPVAWLPVVAAAAIVLMVAWPLAPRFGGRVEHRDETVTAASPRPIHPFRGSRPLPGSIPDADRALLWSSVPVADGYRLRLFDAQGETVWETETPDTIATLPDSLALRAGATYFWRVEARTGFDRWAASELVEFVPDARRAPP